MDAASHGIAHLLSDKGKGEDFAHFLYDAGRCRQYYGVRHLFGTQGSECAGHFDLVMSEVITAEAEKDALLQAVGQQIDLPVFGEQDPVRLFDLIFMAEHQLRFNVARNGNIQTAQGIKCD